MNNKPMIIIIDDEEVVLDSCTMILEGSDYNVKTAQDGATGLELVNKLKPDLVYIDLKMPGMPGIDVLERITASNPLVVSIVITGYATVTSAVEAMKKGAYDFLPKPFTPDEFRLITKRGIERRRLMVEAGKLRVEKEMLRENFAAIVSHELKSPLGAIQQNLYAMSSELSGSLSESQNARLERMKIRIDDLLKLINSWLRVYSVDITKIKDNYTSVPVSSIISKAIENIQPEATRKDIRIVPTQDSIVTSIDCDEVSLTEALVNIIGNAVKYSFEGSQVLVKATQTNGNVDISITDTGVGIAAEELPYVLSDFYKGKDGHTGVESHGIGLTISRRIIEAHDGSISVKSEPSKGTTFTISIPCTKQKRP